MPKVSVIIPVYNGEKYLRDAIGSVLAQTYTDFELIVVDDGSTDRSGRIVREEFGHVAQYHYQPNGGSAKARNSGVKASRGRYIAFLDADDLWMPEKLALQVPVLDTRPEIGLVHSDVEQVDPAGRHVRVWKNSGRMDAYARRLVKGHVIAAYASLVRREILERVGGFDEDFPAAAYEDLEFSIRVGQVCEIYCVDRPLAKHRDHGESASSDEERGLRNRALFVEKMVSRFGDDRAHRRFLSGERARCLSDFGKYLVNRGERRKGRILLAQSIGLSVGTLHFPVAMRAFGRLTRSLV